MPDNESLQAAMYGPLVLAARFEDEPREKWYRHFSGRRKAGAVAHSAIQGQDSMIRRVGSNQQEESSGSAEFHRIKL